MPQAILCRVNTIFAIKLAPGKCLTAATQVMAHVTAMYCVKRLMAKKIKNFSTSRSKPAIKYRITEKKNGTGTSSVGIRANLRERM